MADDDLNNPRSRAVNWAKDQVRRRNEAAERQERWEKAHPMAHPWKVPIRTDIPPGVIPFGDLYLIL